MSRINEAKSREESVDAHLHEAEDEMATLRGEVRQLPDGEREELEADYQKQVDECSSSVSLLYEETWHQAGRPFNSSGEEKKLLDKPAP
ncbi:hypothetical protein CK203_012804 [Vitis vinifera]|uniref:Uncharacterized protein n=1 Tax=Vitis vinifera TaxID=29760 RepID=A0A438JLN9_VITVI|nr:hypothetical protein CK203_012804 [Vitis vinifera]